MKLCKDCRHFRPWRAVINLFGLLKGDQYYYGFAKCALSRRVVFSDIEMFVSGTSREQIKMRYCEFARTHGDCGPDGGLWEQKP